MDAFLAKYIKNIDLWKWCALGFSVLAIIFDVLSVRWGLLQIMALLFMIMAVVTAVYLLKTGITEIAVPVIALILCKVSQIYTTVLVLIKLVIWIFGINFIYHFIR